MDIDRISSILDAIAASNKAKSDAAAFLAEFEITIAKIVRLGHASDALRKSIGLDSIPVAESHLVDADKLKDEAHGIIPQLSKCLKTSQDAGALEKYEIPCIEGCPHVKPNNERCTHQAILDAMAVVANNTSAIVGNVRYVTNISGSCCVFLDKISNNIKYIAAVVRNLNASTELISCKKTRERHVIADAAKAARARADAAALTADAAAKAAAKAEAEAEAAEAAEAEAAEAEAAEAEAAKAEAAEV